MGCSGTFLVLVKVLVKKGLLGLQERLIHLFVMSIDVSKFILPPVVAFLLKFLIRIIILF